MTRTRKLRSLNLPQPISAEADEEGRPANVFSSRRKLTVIAHNETWLIEDEWWRAHPIARRYWRVTLEDGRAMDIFHDLAGGGWFRQSYG